MAGESQKLKLLNLAKMLYERTDESHGLTCPEIIAGLAEAGIEEGKNLTVIYQNAQADMGITQQIAAQFAAKPVDLMVGIATPMAQACYNAAAGAIPTIYTAVSDPVAAVGCYAL